jgi:hypothetical protein
MTLGGGLQWDVLPVTFEARPESPRFQLSRRSVLAFRQERFPCGAPQVTPRALPISCQGTDQYE